MKQVILAVIVLCLALLACGAPTPTLKTADDYVKEYGGSRDAFQEILSLTDCAALQAKFDTASANNSRETAGTPLFKVTLGYMKAADQRMKDLSCYGSSSGKPINTVNAVLAPTQIASTSTAFFLPTLTKPATVPPLETLEPTATVIFILPTNAPVGSVPGICSCSGDNLNCSDFPDQGSAQACFDYCMQQGAGDINKLDQNNDNNACEAN